jgi:hypothetical protein
VIFIPHFKDQIEERIGTVPDHNVISGTPLNWNDLFQESFGSSDFDPQPSQRENGAFPRYELTKRYGNNAFADPMFGKKPEGALFAGSAS